MGPNLDKVSAEVLKHLELRLVRMWDLNPRTSVLPRDRRKKAHRHGGEGHVKTEERSEGGTYMPLRNSLGLQELGEERRIHP